MISYSPENDIPTATRQLLDVIERASYCNMGLSYYSYMRALFKTIIWHNICKKKVKMIRVKSLA